MSGMAASRDAHFRVQFVVDDVLRRLQCHLFQVVGGGLDEVHLLGGKFVERGLIPVRLLAGVPGKPDFFDLLLPVGAW